MTFKLIRAAICIWLCGMHMQSAYAASQNDCAIWLCLPAGFPSGCSGAHSAFKTRLKHGRPLLPNLLSCTSGPNGERVSGRYETGREEYEPCAENYVLKRKSWMYQNEAICVVRDCFSQSYDAAKNYCDGYEAVMRPKPNYIKLWVSGDYLGQFFYQ